MILMNVSMCPVSTWCRWMYQCILHIHNTNAWINVSSTYMTQMNVSMHLVHTWWRWMYQCTLYAHDADECINVHSRYKSISRINVHCVINRYIMIQITYVDYTHVRDKNPLISPGLSILSFLIPPFVPSLHRSLGTVARESIWTPTVRTPFLLYCSCYVKHIETVLAL